MALVYGVYLSDSLTVKNDEIVISNLSSKGLVFRIYYENTWLSYYT